MEGGSYRAKDLDDKGDGLFFVELVDTVLDISELEGRQTGSVAGYSCVTSGMEVRDSLFSGHLRRSLGITMAHHPHQQVHISSPLRTGEIPLPPGISVREDALQVSRMDGWGM